MVTATCTAPSAPPALQARLVVAIDKAETVAWPIVREAVELHREALAWLCDNTPAGAHEPGAEWCRLWWTPFVDSSGCAALRDVLDEITAIIGVADVPAGHPAR